MLESEATRKGLDDKEMFPRAGAYERIAAFIIHVQISEGEDRSSGVLKSSPKRLQRVCVMGPEKLYFKTK